MRKQHITAFYLEALLMIIVFISIILVLTRVFGSARVQSVGAKHLTASVTLAQNAAEAVSASRTPQDLLELLNKDGNAVLKEEAAAARSTLIAVYDTEMNPVRIPEDILKALEGADPEQESSGETGGLQEQTETGADPGRDSSGESGGLQEQTETGADPGQDSSGESGDSQKQSETGAGGEPGALMKSLRSAWMPEGGTLFLQIIREPAADWTQAAEDASAPPLTGMMNSAITVFEGGTGKEIYSLDTAVYIVEKD